jgi:hypothetical protein
MARALKQEMETELRYLEREKEKTMKKQKEPKRS